MAASLEIKRSFLPFGFSANYRYEITPPAYFISALTDKLLSRLVLPLKDNKGTLTDLKGRESSSALTYELLPAIEPLADELLLIQGKVFLPLSEKAREYEGLEENLFSLALTTSFLEFSGAHHIINSLRERREGSLPDFVNLQSVARIFPVQIDYVRVGLETFQSRLISAMLGFAPSVEQSITLEYNEKRMIIKILAEGLRKRDELPFSHNALLETISAALKDYANFDLKEHYSALL